MTETTDREWEKFGRSDPYYGVISMDRFRSSGMREEDFRDFFRSGDDHVRFVLQTLEGIYGAGLTCKRALDFGCGVGRCTFPLAKNCGHATGVDASPSMTGEAKKNAEKFGLSDAVSWSDSLDSLQSGSRFDLIHSFIVFQHIRPKRGLLLFRQMLNLLEDGGFGAVQFLYRREVSTTTKILGWARARIPGLNPLVNSLYGKPLNEPLMEKNVYDLNVLLATLKESGCEEVHIRFQGKGRLKSVFLFFRKVRSPVPYDEFYGKDETV